VETTKDSVKYIRPFYSKTADGRPLDDKAQAYEPTASGDGTYDPWDYSKGGEFNGDELKLSRDGAIYHSVRRLAA
jgi:hypothetical protein